MPFSDESHPLLASEEPKACPSCRRRCVKTNAFAMDERAFELWGLPQTSKVTFEDLSSRIHPATATGCELHTANRALVGAYDIHFRILLSQEIRWISARGLGNDEGPHNGQMSGVFLDVNGRKQAEECHELLAGEMSNRLKNLLAVAAGLTTLPYQEDRTRGTDVAQVLHHHGQGTRRASGGASSIRTRQSEMTDTTETAEGRPAQGMPGEFFSAFLKLGLASFGGPIAHLGYFCDEMVIRRKWLSDHAYADLALCQFLPGPASSQVGFAARNVARGLARSTRGLHRLQAAIGAGVADLCDDGSVTSRSHRQRRFARGSRSLLRRLSPGGSEPRKSTTAFGS